MMQHLHWVCVCFREREKTAKLNEISLKNIKCVNTEMFLMCNKVSGADCFFVLTQSQRHLTGEEKKLAISTIGNNA